MPSLLTTLRTVFAEPNLAMHPREDFATKANLASNGAETLPVDADGCSTVAIDLRGALNLTLVVEGTINGVDWSLIPMRPLNQNAVLWVPTISGTTPGIYAIERYSLTAQYENDVTGTRIRQRSPIAKIERTDLTS